MKKLADVKSEFELVLKGIKLIYKIQKSIIFTYMLQSLFVSLSPFINIYMSALILNGLIVKDDIYTLTNLILITILLNFAAHIITNLLKQIKEVNREAFRRQVEMVISEKTLNMDYEHVENVKVQNLKRSIKEASMMSGGGLYNLIFYADNFFKSFLTVVFSSVLSFKLFFSGENIEIDGLEGFLKSYEFSYIFLFIILFIVAGIMVLNKRKGIKEFKLFSNFLFLNRVSEFYGNYIGSTKTGKDIRIFNQQSLLEREFKKFHGGAIKAFTAICAVGGRYGALTSFLSSLLGGLVYLFVALKAIIGIISIGDIVKYAGSINQFIQGFTSMMNSVVELKTNNQYLKLYFDYLEIKDLKYEGTLPVEKRNDNKYKIEFKNVSFKYPGTDKFILKNLSIKFNIGQHLAIVGMNGSGKTTFIKLLCRLYDPTEGEILLNGIDIRKYDYKEYLSLFSVVFQDFKLFSFSLAQNVASSVDYDEKHVKRYLQKAGFNLNEKKMTKGINTCLYRDFNEDGVEISGGEAQKIAIARALYKDAPFVILDEPTAALDPISEFEIYSKFNELMESKTAIYISHRLSSCRFCDKIAVFDNGTINQLGSHDELLKDTEGKYYSLWQAQAQYYV